MGYRIVSTLYILSFILGIFSAAVPPKNFRFNCIYDICTFPIQFCDIEDQRCHYCNQDVCRSEKVPDQCYYYCNNDLDAATKATTTSSISSARKGKLESTACSDCNLTLQSQTIFIIGGVAVLAVLALVVTVSALIYFICKRNNQTYCKHDLLHRNQANCINIMKPLLPIGKGYSNIPVDGQARQSATPTNGGDGDTTSNNSNISQPSGQNSEGHHYNPNDNELLNLNPSSPSNGENTGINGIHPTRQADDNDGRHHNINDNQFLDTNLSSANKDSASLLKSIPTSGQHGRNGGPISSPTEEEAPNRHGDVGNVKFLKGRGHDSGFNDDGETTDVKLQFETAQA